MQDAVGRRDTDLEVIKEKLEVELKENFNPELAKIKYQYFTSLI